jgi:hypothetical protein
MKTIALRIDDIGASTKRFEVYSKRKFGNFLFLKYLNGFKAWGPYREMIVSEWIEIFNILRECSAKLTVGITAAWVERNGDYIPFPEKYPDEADVLKDGLDEGLLEIANHGLTHCVVGKHLPRLFSSNRKYHREFWDWVPREVHFEHIEKSQAILQDYFETRITTLIPPGNVFSNDTVEAAAKYGIERINYRKWETSSLKEKIKIINGETIFENNLPLENVIRFHDKEIVLEGVVWLKDKLEAISRDAEFVFVKEL